jgi:hypothetical protein
MRPRHAVGCRSAWPGLVRHGKLQSRRILRLMQYIHHIGPVAALIAGILILVMPRLLNYIVALYLIIVGLTGLL